MGRRYRAFSRDQRLLLAPDLREWLPSGHLANFILDVVPALDLREIHAVYESGDGRGQPPFDPEMMVGLLLYGYSTGKFSSRKLEKATYEEVPYRVLSADQHPDHDTISEFRARHLPALGRLFEQILKLCREAGLVKLGHVALDGTKVAASASKRKAMSYGRMCQKEIELERQIKELFDRAAEVDAAEDEQYGRGVRGDELPAELQRRESRLRKIREAKAALEEQARQEAAARAREAEQKNAKRAAQEVATGKKMGGRAAQVPDPESAKPADNAQRNFTDADSRIMKDGASGSFMQGYNAQAAVDHTTQIIVAAAVTQSPNDRTQLQPMIEQVAANCGELPGQVTADTGYFNSAQITAEALKNVDLYVATGRLKHDAVAGEELPKGSLRCPVAQQMRAKLETPQGQAAYGLRKAIVEPVFGQIKEVRGFRRFSFRGYVKVHDEWSLVCLTHNLRKLHRYGAQFVRDHAARLASAIEERQLATTSG